MPFFPCCTTTVSVNKSFVSGRYQHAVSDTAGCFCQLGLTCQGVKEPLTSLTPTCLAEAGLAQPLASLSPILVGDLHSDNDCSQRCSKLRGFMVENRMHTDTDYLSPSVSVCLSVVSLPQCRRPILLPLHSNNQSPISYDERRVELHVHTHVIRQSRLLSK